MSLPRQFCWSKIGTEAGEGVSQILARKEIERRQNGGIFLWGIGNPIGPSMQCLAQLEALPEVIFSPIRSSPKQHDVVPQKVAVWTEAETLSGHRYRLPEHSIVTSRLDQIGTKARHYALVCRSHTQLEISQSNGVVRPSRLRNIRSGRHVGYSQVTAIVQQIDREDDRTKQTYPIAMRVQLADPYFITLKNPIDVPCDILETPTDDNQRYSALQNLVRSYRNPGRLPLFAAAGHFDV